jgi:hypothetical protein
MAKAAKKKIKRFDGGGVATTSANVPQQQVGNQTIGLSTPPFSGGTPQGGPPYFPNYTLPSALASQNKLYSKGGSVKSASKRADGCAIRGKTRAR